MKKFQEEKNLTYLFIAHDLSVVRFISDRIGVIYRNFLKSRAPMSPRTGRKKERIIYQMLPVSVDYGGGRHQRRRQQRLGV